MGCELPGCRPAQRPHLPLRRMGARRAVTERTRHPKRATGTRQICVGVAATEASEPLGDRPRRRPVAVRFFGADHDKHASGRGPRRKMQTRPAADQDTTSRRPCLPVSQGVMTPSIPRLRSGRHRLTLTVLNVWVIPTSGWKTQVIYRKARAREVCDGVEGSDLADRSAGVGTRARA